MTELKESFQDLLDLLTGRPRQPQNWRALLSVAANTLTIGALADVLLAPDSKVEIPSEFRELLEDVLARARNRNIRVRQQFTEALAALNGAGIEPITMKGLSRLLNSPREESRILSDIDLLVPSGSRDKCVLALEPLGYEILVGAEEEAPPVLARSSDVATIDLHTALKPFYLGLGYDSIAAHCTPLRCSDGTALVPSATCELLLIVLHDQLNDRDYWRGLIDVRHLLDMRRLVEEGIDWPLLASFFPTGTPKRAFEVQMRTARSMLEIEIPERYCGGIWASMQVLRRRVQARVPATRAPFTLLTMLIDRPRESLPRSLSSPRPRGRAIPRLRKRLERYLWQSQPGKLC